MAIIKVEVATGFSADIEQTKQDPDIKKVEIESGIVNIYFDDVSVQPLVVKKLSPLSRSILFILTSFK